MMFFRAIMYSRAKTLVLLFSLSRDMVIIQIQSHCFEFRLLRFFLVIPDQSSHSFPSFSLEVNNKYPVLFWGQPTLDTP